ncbi:Fur family transcriptional regulator [Nocardioides zeae]
MAGAHRPAGPGDGAEPDWRARLRAQGYRLTPQRELILQAVTTLRHATPDEVLAEVRKSSAAVNLSTIYRTLEVLEGLGLVRHAHLNDRAPTFHAVDDGHEHFHLVCRKCGRVSSVDVEEAAPFLDALRDRRGFVADAGHLAIFGECVHCPTEEETQ